MFPSNLNALSSATVLLAIPAIPLLTRFFFGKRSRRLERIPHSREHVLILGASSGVGRELAGQYVARGARVCIVARREAELRIVYTECLAVAEKEAHVIMEAADFSEPEQMVKLRDRLEEEWGCLDTMHVVAGVSALRPLLEIAGVVREGKIFIPNDAGPAELKEGVSIAHAAMRGNFTGPLVAALAFVPFMTRTSPSPSISLLSSLASVIPAPTRALYASSKTSALMLYQALAIEHPEIAFTNILPSTIEGDFRASAVDSGPIRETEPNKHGLKRDDVARRCIMAVDNGEKNVFMDAKSRWGHLLYWVLPSVVEGAAREKYNFKA